jgi:DNA-binding MarR family transcriptional regulator
MIDTPNHEHAVVALLDKRGGRYDDPSDGLVIKRMADELGLDNSVMSQTVSRLEARGVLGRERLNAKRTSAVWIIDAGKIGTPINHPTLRKPGEQRVRLVDLLVANGGRLENRNGFVISDIARRLDTTTRSISQLVIALHKEKFVVKHTNGKRTYYVEVTEKGRHLLQGRSMLGLGRAVAPMPSTTSVPAAPQPLAIQASEIIPVKLRMLWRDRLPVGQVSVIAGKQGMGKSTLSVTIAAELSSAGLTVIMSNQEDDPAAVIRPRLDVAGANLDLVHIIPMERTPILPRDFDLLADLVRITEASCLLLDPVAGHYPSQARMHSRPEVSRLMRLARERQCAIVALHHTTKSMSLDAQGLIGGPSGGLSGAARAVYLYGYDQADQDRRALACVKVNGFETPPTLVVAHEVTEYSSNGHLLEAAYLRFVEESNSTATSVMRRGQVHYQRDAECHEWLCELLVEGGFQLPLSEIREEGRKVGFGSSTLSRIFTELHLERGQITVGDDGFTVWRLPDDHPLRMMESDDADE